VVDQTARQTRSSLPTGTVTFLFSDIEGSTRLVTALGDAFGPLLERHHAILREAFEASGGTDIGTEGDAFFVVFESAPAAVAAAVAAQLALAAEPWGQDSGPVRVRMGLHTGEGTLGGDNYIGIDVNRAARIAAAAHGGQVLISAATRALVESSLPGGVRLRDLGAYRLKDLDQPERLVQLDVVDLPAEFPPPRTMEVPSNLPTQLTSFIGRDREVAEVIELLGGSRLVTLTGPGGTGKTRLSLRVAELAADGYSGGAFFAELAPITDAGLIPTTIAQAVGLRVDPARPVIDSLEAHLRDLKVLLVLDNFEQVLDGAPLVGRLLQAAARLSVIATSRESLRVRGEQEYPVPPLGLPDPRSTISVDALSQYEAVALFIQRARAVKPDFAVTNDNAPAVAAICVGLDGLPLAIELAAARSKLFSPEAILARLGHRLALLSSTARDLPERQRTLRGAIDWSHDLLDPHEQALFRRLAIFVGGCTIASAAAICAPDRELGMDVADGLTSFADKSLLRLTESEHGEPRFGMLETIREYGLEKLAASEDAATIRQRHQDYFATLALEAEPEVIGGNQKEWLDRLDHEHDNLRGAVRGAADDARIELALRAAAALWRFWHQRGHLVEGREVLDELVKRPDAGSWPGARAKALAALGGVTYWQGDMPSAGAAYAEALRIERDRDDPAALADALYNAGFVAVLTGDPVTARADYTEAIAIYEKLGNPKDLTRVREALVFLMYHQGEYAEATQLQEENVRRFRDAGESYRIANALALLAGINLRAGSFEAAHTHSAESIGIFAAAGDVQSIVRLTLIAAALAAAEKDFARAARLSGAAAALKAPLGEIATPLLMLRLADPALEARAALGDEAFEPIYQRGQAMPTGDIVALVQSPFPTLG
jgi:predicted ATPase/class 3 adenylate cyclase